MNDDPTHQALAFELEQSLALLEDFGLEQDLLPVADPFPSLLAQCQDLVTEIEPPAPIRTLHHFACSGGSLIAKCIAAMPNAVLLSEIDPLSEIQSIAGRTPLPFMPTDILRLLRHTTRRLDENIITRTFTGALHSLSAELSERGYHLVLRDHAHSQFCTWVDPAARPTLQQIVADTFPIRSVVTVRHPLDSFMSLQKNDWVHFSPKDFGEYCRRYLVFLDSYADTPVIQYEDFVEDPETVLREICRLLDLPFSPLAIDLFSVVRVTGDSGRSGQRIAPRPRRSLPDDMRMTCARSDDYAALCNRLGYDTN